MDMPIAFPEPQTERAPFPLQGHRGYDRLFLRYQDRIYRKGAVDSNRRGQRHEEISTPAWLEGLRHEKNAGTSGNRRRQRRGPG